MPVPLLLGGQLTIPRQLSGVAWNGASRGQWFSLLVPRRFVASAVCVRTSILPSVSRLEGNGTHPEGDSSWLSGVGFVVSIVAMNVRAAETTGSERIFEADLELAEAALGGDEEAAAKLLKMIKEPSLHSHLIRRGASPSEANDLLGDLLGDCFSGVKSKGGMHRLLGRYNGRCSLRAFLSRVVVNRLVNLKRRQRHEHTLPGMNSGQDDPFEKIPAVMETDLAEDAVIDLLRGAVIEALAEVDQEKLVLLRLVHSYRLPQKRVGRMWGLSESKISRVLTALLDDLRGRLLASIRRSDPWLQVEWEDFLGLCGESIDLFAPADYHARPAVRIVDHME